LLYDTILAAIILLITIETTVIGAVGQKSGIGTISAAKPNKNDIYNPASGP
jgi:hypothetical protein